MEYKNLTKEIVKLFAERCDRPEKGCWLWTGTINKDGYGQINIRAWKRNILAHRLAFLICKRVDVPDHLLVCHHCDNNWCVNPDHLFLGTHLDNMLDKCVKGRHRGNHKLTEKEVLEIRQSKLGLVKLAEIYEVSKSAIGYIKQGITWKDVK